MAGPVRVAVNPGPRHGDRRAVWSPAGRGLPRVLGAALMGFLLAGALGAVVAVIAVLALRREPRWVLGAALVGVLALAAIATVVEHPLTRAALSLRFASERPLAAALGSAAGVLLALTIAQLAVQERAPSPRADIDDDQPHDGRPRPDAAVVAVGVAALVVRVLGAPEAMPPGYDTLVTSLRGANGYRGTAGFTAVRPPLPAVIAAFAPGPERLALVIVSLTTVLVVMRIAHRIGGRPASIAAGVVAAVLPSMWGQQLPEALAACFVAGTIALAWPDVLTPSRAAAAGVCAAAATLSRPEALLVVPVVLAWIAVARRRGLLPRAAALVGVAAAVVLPWQVQVHSHFDTWLPSTNLGASLAGGLTPATSAGPLLGAYDPIGASPQQGVDEGEQDRALRASARERLADSPVAKLIAARILRGWDLWSPANVGDARSVRDLPTPGGVIAGVVELIASVGVALALWRRRSSWRALLPLVALPIIFTVESAVFFGDRGLRAWVAPVIALAIGLELAGLVAARSERAAVIA